ncbi:TonB-dependent receptor [candidate division KSB1 bacterium]|nr:TonB-dependent receptor [candidate division KSB1 bacterium]
MKRTYLICSLLFVTQLCADVTGRITGQVIDKQTSEPLPGANVYIEGTFIGSSTDLDGRYIIGAVEPGEYTLKAGYIGYKVDQRTIRIEVNRTETADFALEQTALLGEQVVVTGSRQPENLASAASSISILGKEEMSRRNSFRIDESLQAVSGVAIVGENVNIRGGSGYNRLGGSRTLVMLDGVPILTSDLGEANWNIVPVTEVDHIEVSKGASSSLYGSGALSGVINIVTKQASSGHSFSFNQTSGIYDDPSVPQWKWTDDLLHYHKTDMSYSNSIGPVGVRLAVTRHASTSDRENGQFERWYFTGKFSTALSGSANLTLFSTYSTENKGLFLRWLEQDYALNVPPVDRNNTVNLNGYVGYAIYNKLFSPTLSMRARLSYNQQLIGIPFDLSGIFTPAIGLGGEMQFNWKPHKNHSISLGMDYKYDTVESTYYGYQKANNLSPYIQEIWNVSNLVQLNAGLRWDNYILVGDSLETQLSPKIGFSVQPIFGTIIHGSIGRAFRAATVVERFLAAGSTDFQWLANPDLTPERSTLFDVGVRQNIGEKAYAEVAYFYNTYENLIEPTLFSDLTAQFVNYPQAKIEGVETEFRWRLWRDRLRLNVSATWMDHRELETGQPLPYRPNLIAFVAPSLWIGSLGVELDFRHMSRIQRVAVYPLDERVPTNVFDFRIMVKWSTLQLQFLIRNMLNYNYTVSERVLGEIRNFAVSISGDF